MKRRRCACGCGAFVKKRFIKGHNIAKIHRMSPEDYRRRSLYWRGPRHPNWRGGLTDNGDGYIRLRIPGVGYVFLHRQVMEKLLGRPLRRTELVHHKNGDRSDNRPENLEIVSRATHIRLHRPELIRWGHG